MQQKIELKPFTEQEYHEFFRGYVQDPLMNPEPFVYSAEMVSRSYVYNYQYRDHFALYGIFLDGTPVGSFQLKRIDPEIRRCEFGIILQNRSVMNRGIGSEAIRQGERIALEKYGMADRIREFDVSSATVELAAKAVGVEPARICKTLLCG